MCSCLLTALRAAAISRGLLAYHTQDKLDEKSKAALPIPPQLVQLSARSPALGAALKVAFASAFTAVQALTPPEDPKKVGETKKNPEKGL